MKHNQNILIGIGILAIIGIFLIETTCIDECIKSKFEESAYEELGEPKITFKLYGGKAEGGVNGINPANYGDYRVVVYVETDLLYVQPAIKPSSARYKKINCCGSWVVKNLKIGYTKKQRVWAFLIKKESYVPDRLGKGQKPEGFVAESAQDI